MGTSNDRLWETLPLRKDRSPNELNGVVQLTLASHQPTHAMNTSNPTFFTTRFGSVNGDGLEESFSSPILGARNPRFVEALEPAISNLVLTITGLGLVTYTSCEGHFIDGIRHEAHVGFLYDIDRPMAWRAVDAAQRTGFFAFRTWLFDPEDHSRFPTVELYYPFLEIALPDYHHALIRAARSFRRYVNGPPLDPRTQKNT